MTAQNEHALASDAELLVAANKIMAQQSESLALLVAALRVTLTVVDALADAPSVEIETWRDDIKDASARLHAALDPVFAAGLVH